jgi:quercetin dioxygenase-like cupin family protein
VPEGGPPPHIHHNEEESFYVLQGTVRIRAGDRTLHASPGEYVQIPRGMVHSFRNIGNDDAKMLLVVKPAGLEKFFAEAFVRAADPSARPPLLTEASMAPILAAAPKYGLEILPPA